MRRRLGRRVERVLWPDWPHDAPTNLWLSPDSDSVSWAQQQHYYKAILELLDLDIVKAIDEGSKDNLRLTVNDAVRELRHLFRVSEVEGLLAVHNEDYGFARNFAGLSLFWLLASLMIAAASWIIYWDSGAGFTLGVISSFALVVALVLVAVLPGFVRQRAERYAESFFGTLSSLHRES